MVAFTRAENQGFLTPLSYSAGDRPHLAVPRLDDTKHR